MILNLITLKIIQNNHKSIRQSFLISEIMVHGAWKWIKNDSYDRIKSIKTIIIWLRKVIIGFIVKIRMIYKNNLLYKI